MNSFRRRIGQKSRKREVNELFCKECGRGIGNRSLCPYCGGRGQMMPPENYTFTNPYRMKREVQSAGKSRVTAGLLQIFVGTLGLGRFYLGYRKLGLLQLGVSAVTCGMGGLIWGMIDGIMILAGRVETDANGKPLAP